MPIRARTRHNLSENTTEAKPDHTPTARRKDVHNLQEESPLILIGDQSITKYRDRIQNLLDERDEAFSQDGLIIRQKNVDAIADLKRRQAAGEKFHNLTPIGIALEFREKNLDVILTKNIMDRPNINKVEDKILDLRSQFSDLQVADVMRTEGMRGFDTALSITRNADEAFKISLGRVPDREAKIRFYASKLRIPEQQVRENFEVVEEKAIYLDDKTVLDNSPRLLQYVSNPRNMVVAKDSLRGLAHLESLLVSRYGSFTDKLGLKISETFREFRIGFDRGEAAKSAAVGEFYRGAAWIVGGGDPEANDLAKSLTNLVEMGDDFEKSILAQAKQIAAETPRLTEEVAGAERFVLDVAGGTTQIATFIATGLISPTIPLYTMASMEGGHVYGDLRDQGVSKMRALLPAAGVGVINAGLEALQIRSALRAIGVEETGRSALRNVIQSGFENFLQETAQNVVSETGLIIGDQQIKDEAAFEISDRLKEALSQGAYEGLVAAGTMVFLGTPSLVSGGLRYRDSLIGRARFNKAEEILADLPIAERNPEQLDRALEKITDDDEAEILVSAIEEYLQTIPDNADQVRKEIQEKLGIDVEAYAEALDQGLEVGFKLRKYLVNFSNTEIGNNLRDHLAFGNIFSVADTKIMRAKINDQIASLSEIFDDISSNTDALPPQLAVFRQQLMEAGGYDAQDADYIMDLLVSGASRIARETGETLTQWAERTNLGFVLNKDGANLVTKSEAFEAERLATEQAEEIEGKREELFQEQRPFQRLLNKIIGKKDDVSVEEAQAVFPQAKFEDLLTPEEIELGRINRGRLIKLRDQIEPPKEFLQARDREETTENQIQRGTQELIESGAEMSGDERADLYAQTTGNAQRNGPPEEDMTRTQRVIGGGVLSFNLEHVGDLTHRMADGNTLNNMGIEAVSDKVEKTLRRLRNDFGFEREHRQNMRNNAIGEYAETKGIEDPFGDARESIESDPEFLAFEKERNKKVDAALQRYADNHKQIPVFNEVQQAARDAAVALGEQNFDKAESLLSELEDILDLGLDNWTAAARDFDQDIADSNIDPIEGLFQEGDQRPRGKIEFLDGETIITMFKDTGDNSTIIHELGHLFLKQVQQLVESGQASEIMVEKYNILVEWAGGELGDLAHKQKTDVVENIVDAWEAYILEGKAPSVELVGAFRTFQLWLRGIYKNVKQILQGRELSDQVRDAFDFWLAAENEILEAENFYRSSDIASESIIAEFEKDDIAKAERARLAAARKAAEEAREKAIQEREQELQDLWTETSGGREALRKQAEDHIKNQRSYRAIAELRPIGINPLEVSINEADLDLIGKVHGQDLIVPGQDIDLNPIARALGYNDKGQMLGEIAGKKSLEEESNDLYQRMLTVKLQEFRKRAEAIEAKPSDEKVHNDENLDVLIADSILLQQKIGRKLSQRAARAEKKAIQETAFELLKNLRSLREATNYRKWGNREAKWAGRAFEAAEAGDFESAWQAKNKQIHYFSLVQASFKIREQANKIEARLRKTVNFKGVTEGHALSIRDIYTTWRLNKTTQRPEGASDDSLLIPVSGFTERDEGLRFLVPEFQEIFPSWLLNKKMPEDYKNIKDLTFEQLIELDSALSFLFDRGRKELKVLKELGFKNVEEMAQASIKRMETLPDKFRAETREGLGSLKEIANQLLEWVTMPEFMMEEADGSPLLKGEPLGPMHKLFHMLRERDAEFDLRREEITTGNKAKGIVGLTDIAKVMERERKRMEKQFGGKTFQVPGLPIPEPFLRPDINIRSWDFYKLLSLALNLGNDANIHALQASEYQFTDEQLEIVKKLFSAEAWNSIQDTWNTINTLFEDFEQAKKDTTFTSLPKEFPQPLTVNTADGEQLNLRGGYYPLMFDPKISPLAAANQEIRDIEDIARKESIFRTSVKPRSGATNARLRDKETGEALSKRPPLLDMSVLHKHLQDSIRYITHARIMQEIDLLTRHPEWRDTFLRKFGRNRYQQLRKSINYVARPERRIEGTANKLMERGRNLFTINILGLKITTGLKQRLSEINAVNAMNRASGTRTGFKYLMEGHRLVGWKSNAIGKQKASITDFIHKRSKFMAARALGNFDRDIRDMMAGVQPFRGKITIGSEEISFKEMQEVAFWWVRANDRAAVYPLWLGAYHQALNLKLNGIKETMTQDEAEKLAAQFADTIVTTSQPTGAPADLSAAQRDEGFVRVILVAMTWVLKAGNRQMSFVRAFKRGDISWKVLAEHFAIEWWMPALAQLALPTILYDERNKPEWYEYFYNPIHDGMGWMPGVSQALNGLRYGPAEIPSFEGFIQAGRGFKNLAKGDAEKAAIDLIKAVFWFTGVPLDNIPTDLAKYHRRISGD